MLEKGHHVVQLRYKGFLINRDLTKQDHYGHENNYFGLKFEK